MARNGLILVIDDEEIMREILEVLLTREGYEVRLATNGADGLELARAMTFDAAIVDVMMPTMGGLEFRQRLFDTAPSVATILVTGQPDRVEDLVEDDPDFQTGRVSILYKPVHPVTLLAEIDKRLVRLAAAR